MRVMDASAVYNLSGRAIPDNAKIAISGEARPGDVLVIETFDGTTGAARWRSATELKTRLAQRGDAAAKPAAAPAWSPPLKPRAPYS
jgi:hypothetical protein